MRSKTKPKYWYVLKIYGCSVCGSEEKIRERVYKKPKSYFEWHQDYDSCVEFGGLY